SYTDPVRTAPLWGLERQDIHLPTFRVIGPGRAGRSLQTALEAAGWRALAPLGRGDELAAAASDADVVVIAVPDTSIADVAAAITPSPATTVVHLAGSLGLDVLAPH